MCNKRNSKTIKLGKRTFRVDGCMRDLIISLNNIGINTLACCCGHSKYQITIIYKHKDGKIYEFCSGIEIKRKTRFYLKDRKGFYFIPEVLNKKRTVIDNSIKRKVKKYKRYKYSKVNPKMEKEMIALRKKGLSYDKISKKIGVSHVTVEYHTNKEFKERLKEKERNKKNKNTKEYNRKYHRDRYNNDPEFRDRTLKIIKKNNHKIINERKKLNLCVKCGKNKSEGSNFMCKKCKKESSIKSKNNFDKRKKLGLCLRCKKKLPDRKHVYCKICRKKRREELCLKKK